MKKLITSESVTEGHPDKLADRVSDAVLDAILLVDAEARVAVETVITKGLVLVTGEVSCRGYIDLQRIVRDTIREVGYTNSTCGIDADHCAVLIAIGEQSSDIALGVDRELNVGIGDVDDQIGAGDQGMMIGYASDETQEYMPLPITLAHRLTHRLAELRKSRTLPYLLPDGKAQVTVAYDGDIPINVTTIVLSAQHMSGISQDEVRRDLVTYVIGNIVPEYLLNDETVFFINPTGRFVQGGPAADAGLTGRKIIVDTYGGIAPHGGGAFSGKDPTKVDRSGSYYARFIAKNIVAAGLARRCQVHLAYAIGVTQPVSMYIDDLGSSKLSHEVLSDLVAQVFDARPASIIAQLDLRNPIFTATSAYGHFGRSCFPWEQLDRVDELQALLTSPSY